MSSSWWWLPWVALASAVGVVPAVLAWRRGRHASALRWIGWAIVPWAAWLLGLVSLVARVSDAFVDWTARFVFNPAAWVGIILSVIATALIVGGARVAGRGRADKPAGQGTGRPATKAGGRPAVAAKADPEDEDIEAILRRHGIT
jgi:hypothetical protein